MVSKNRVRLDFSNEITNFLAYFFGIPKVPGTGKAVPRPGCFFLP